jgi:hypothetical protein
MQPRRNRGLLPFAKLLTHPFKGMVAAEPSMDDTVMNVRTYRIRGVVPL